MNNLLKHERCPNSLDTPLKVAINAQIHAGAGFGGVESALTGLVYALGQLQDGDEEYLIISPCDGLTWLEPYAGPNQRIISGPLPSRSRSKGMEFLGRLIAPLKPRARSILEQLFPSVRSSPWPQVPVSEGFYENLGCDVIHFPYQEFVVCAMPSIYNPHDLQHLHYPQFFTPSKIAWRETIYPAACHFAHTVVVGSQWVKEDVVRHYRPYEEKVQVIPWAPPTQAYPPPSSASLKDAMAKYKLTLPFTLYPAVTWEHKNHLRLLDAIAYLRDHDSLFMSLVCTGYQHPPFWPKIVDRLEKLRLNQQVKFLGNIPSHELRSLYRLSQFVIVPTLFEAVSGPVFEAWQEGTAVACSAVTSLPEQVSDAALLFDPFSVQAIVGACKRMATDAHLRAQLSENGKNRLLDFSWERTAKAYRAVYRRAARRSLSDEDTFLLSRDWMKNPLREKENNS